MTIIMRMMSLYIVTNLYGQLTAMLYEGSELE